jgi:hypothetical protein
MTPHNDQAVREALEAADRATAWREAGYPNMMPSHLEVLAAEVRRLSPPEGVARVWDAETIGEAPVGGLYTTERAGASPYWEGSLKPHYEAKWLLETGRALRAFGPIVAQPPEGSGKVVRGEV